MRFPFVLLIILWALSPSLRTEACSRRLIQDSNEQIGPEWQAEQRARYLLEIAPRLKEDRSPYQRLPSGLPRPYVSAFRELFNFLRDDQEVFRQLQRFEKEVVFLSKQQGISAKEAFIQTLNALEKEYGFGPVHHEKNWLKRDAFMRLLKDGRPIFDDHFIGHPHTVHGHRVMSILASRHLAQKSNVPHLYSILYRLMGDTEIMKSLGWELTGLDSSKINYANPETMPDLFGYLHDTSFFTPDHFSIQADNFTNPLFFSLLRAYVPGLSGWE